MYIDVFVSIKHLHVHVLHTCTHLACTEQCSEPSKSIVLNASSHEQFEIAVQQPSTNLNCSGLRHWQIRLPANKMKMYVNDNHVYSCQ